MKIGQKYILTSRYCETCAKKKEEKRILIKNGSMKEIKTDTAAGNKKVEALKKMVPVGQRKELDVVPTIIKCVGKNQFIVIE